MWSPFNGWQVHISNDSRMDKVSIAFTSNKKLMRKSENLDGRVVRMNGRVPVFIYYITDEVYATLTPMRHEMFNVRVSRLLTYFDDGDNEHAVEEVLSSYNMSDNVLVSYIKDIDPDSRNDQYPFYDSRNDTLIE